MKEEKGGTTTVGKTRTGFLASSWGFALLRTNTPFDGTPTHLFGLNTVLCLRLSAGVSPPSAGQKKTGFGECRSSVANLAKSERLGGERRVKIFCCFQSM